MSTFTTRPVITGTHGMVTSDHYLASFVGANILSNGGNAFDSAAATAFALAVTQPHLNSIGGELAALFYSVKEERIVAVEGQGQAPHGTDIEWFKTRGISTIPGDGMLPAVVPGMVGAWIEILKIFGSMKLSEILEPSIELAESGFPLHWAIRETISKNGPRFQKQWPTTARIFLPDGVIPNEGEIFRQIELGKTLRLLIDAEKSASSSNRVLGLEAARREFYEGSIGQDIARFVKETYVIDSTGFSNKGWLGMEDLEGYCPIFESPVSSQYEGMEVFKCGPWSQGPAFLEQLNILENFDIRRLGHNTADYLHLFIESAKLAYSDREQYYGDPNFDKIPLESLLSKEYSRKQSRLIDMGNARTDSSLEEHNGLLQSSAAGTELTGSSDTVHLNVIDNSGNMISATQSGGWFQSSPIVDTLGFALSTRGQMFYLDPKRNNCLAPGKRPRTTLSPTLVAKDSTPSIIFGTPGGDQQDQWNIQFFLNHTVFGMSLQEALDAPSIYILHFPSSFYPKNAQPRKVVVEKGISLEVNEELERRGHLVEKTGGWQNGRVTVARRNTKTGVLMGAASAKVGNGNTAYAIGW